MSNHQTDTVYSGQHSSGICAAKPNLARETLSSAIIYIVNISITLFDGYLMGVYVHAKVVRFHLAWNSRQLAVNHG